MCRIYATRKSPTTIYIELKDDTYWGVKKLTREKYKYAKSFRNMDFLGTVAKPTDADKDEMDALMAVPFVDEDVIYSEREYL